MKSENPWPCQENFAHGAFANVGKRRGVDISFWTAIRKNEIIASNGLKEDEMAGNLHVRNLEEGLVARLKRRAARHGRSTEAEHREILRQALAAEIEPSFDKLAADLRKLTKGRRQTPSEVLQREGRAER